MTAFVAGQILTAAQLNAAFAQYLPIGGVSTYSQTLLSSTTPAAWLFGLGLPDGAPGGPNGLAILDAGGFLPLAQLPAALQGAMSYQGTWNATTNTPHLASGTGTKGFLYKTATAGTTTLDGINQWNVGDMAVFNGSTWDKWDGISSEVLSVAGRVGAVTLTTADLTDTTTVGRALATAANVAAVQLALSLRPGIDIQAHSTLLDAVSTLAIAAGDLIYGSGSGTVSRLPKGTDGQVLTLASGAPAWVTGSSAWAPGIYYGLTLSAASSTTIGIAAGGARNEDAGAAVNIVLAAAITKSLSAWAAGSGNGGLDTGAIAANTWYHVHLIAPTGGGTPDAIISLSATAPSMPTGYTSRFLIESFKTNGSSQITAFQHIGDRMLWSSAVIDVNSVNPGASAVTVTTSVPTGRAVTGIYDVGVYNASTPSLGVNVSALSVPDVTPQNVATASLTAPASVGGGAGGSPVWSFSSTQVPTNTSGQIRIRTTGTGSSDRTGLITRGWIRTHP